MTAEFRSPYRHGFARVAACTVPVALADPTRNAEAIAESIGKCHDDGVALAVFPELSLSGYAIDDLRQQDALLDAVEAQIEHLRTVSETLLPVIVIGAPLRARGRLYNTAVVLHRGRILGVVPKSYLPNYREFYEARQFASGAGLRNASIRLGQADVPFGVDLLFGATDVTGFVLGVEICEDLWVPEPPSGALTLSGATVIANPSASPVTIGRARERHLLCAAQSARTLSAYVYAAAGPGESTTDLAWDGQATVHEAGRLLAESDRFPDGARIVTADIDCDLLRQDRMRAGTFGANADHNAIAVRRIDFTLDPPLDARPLKRRVPRFPFVPDDPSRLAEDCYEAWTIQVMSLRQRLEHSGSQTMVIGVSGGLDSTLALLVCARVADEIGWPRTAIHGFTMPGFGTGSESLGFAHGLMKTLGITARELDIRPSADLMLREIGHPFANGEAVHDITFENVQAGLRTDFLFRLANQARGIVVGTGDLSEVALGWCTYGVGDQMSHYNVNAGMPKTLIQHLIRWLGRDDALGDGIGALLNNIVSAEISPELVPAGIDGKAQSTEAQIGPYALQDFTLFHVLRYGFRPSKIAYLAEVAWSDAGSGDWPAHFPKDARIAYDLPTIAHWMRVFLRRFFATSQFKRSAMPNGPRLSAAGSLSPRGDWRAPSDGNARVWLEELELALPSG
ncbi:NAD(+) synthase [Tanticharoenia sakaeratensis]|uniref:Glutamine-dependent NAD(+) synthetase n=1 Tax=Tanticharoenia sakaeratensis NBRC 103193 TaxID=1231623 RepID=A0A0D6MLK4_9PROT|nr:NAD(+) synthase [Tanticharoenia sakaeratensis]GAN54552.1 NAD synthetase [Tanticharoenia sakaeratensis NBRC 103193]GBQ24450.1 NAD synthetase [Tanticharoenia sakaeratensis NBRC 103193]